MATLAQESCEACQAGAPRLTTEELAELKPKIPEWSVVERDSVAQLQRRYSFKNFVQALAFANRVGELAESNNHHPEITVEWGATTVTWWTHKINGLHKNDAIMAAKSDDLYPQS